MLETSGAGLSKKLQKLQERDKQMLASRPTNRDIKTAVAAIGTCTDMCPEEERYFRYETKNVSTLEMDISNEMDPYAMVKDYRRSVADQTEPLPHQLRPPIVLLRTMDYLICNIMDKQGENPKALAEWYDFLWSRTRAIRKDITQQHLCDTVSISLLEKCARFHIHCASAMVEEPITVFDPKINYDCAAECMQSVMNMYCDLSKKTNETFPNEAEFRCYDILFNLQDANIISGVPHLPKEIRESPEIKFAVEVYFAFFANNFVEFFRLVKKASYLSACILHRYFNQVRMRALILLCKSHTNGSRETSFRTSEFIRLLRFDDYEQVKSFCEYFSVPANKDTITFTKATARDKLVIVKPMSNRRSVTLVESKKTSSVAEIVQGGPLPSNPYGLFPLHNSFDAHGNLIDPSSPPRERTSPPLTHADLRLYLRKTSLAHSNKR